MIGVKSYIDFKAIVMSDNKEHRISTSVLVKSSFWYTISSYLTHAIGFITTPIFTRILSKAEYGDFSVYVSWQNILIIICGIEVFNTINRARFDYTEEKDFNAYISSCLLLSSFVTAVVFAAYMLFQDFFYGIMLVKHKYMLVMFLYAFAIPAFSMFQTKQRITYRYKLNAGISFALVISSSVLSVVLATVMTEERIFGRILGQYILYVVVGLAFYAYFLKKRVAFNLSYIKYAMQIAIPLVLSLLATNILMSSDNFVVKHLCDSEMVSNISLSHTVTNIILVLVRTLNGAWAPWFYDQLKVCEYRSIRKTFSIYIWLLVAGTVAVLLLGPEIMSILGGGEYADALDLLPMMLLNGILTALLSQFVYLETYHKKNKYAAIITGCAAVFNIGMDIAGVKLWDYKAVCYATVLTQTLMIIAHYRVTIKMEIRKILPAKDLFSFLSVSLALIPLSLLLYRNDFIRWGFVAVLVVGVGVVAVIKRKELMKLVVRFRKHAKKA